MSTVSFGAGETVVEKPAESAVAAPTNTSANRAVGAANPLLGDYVPTMQDVILERVNISQALGKLKEAFSVGTLVFGRKTILYSGPDIDLATGTVRRAATPPAVITALGITKKRFVEKVPWGSQGMTVNTEEQVIAAGGTLDYQEYELKKKDGMKRFQPMVDFMVAIRKPDHVADDGTVFNFDVEGVKYTVGLWLFKGPSYTNACKRVLFPDRLKGCTKDAGYPSFSYSVTTRLEDHGGGLESMVPVFTVKERNSAAFLEFAQNIISPKN